MLRQGEASRIKQEFWTTFGRYMAPVLSSEGERINWVNYHTGIKSIYFRMDAGPRSASIAISIEHKDPVIRELYFEQFGALRQFLHAELSEEWIWQQNSSSNNRFASRIYKSLMGPSVYNKDSWPDLISFFKPRIIALDSFWVTAKFGFESLT